MPIHAQFFSSADFDP